MCFRTVPVVHHDIIVCFRTLPKIHARHRLCFRTLRLIHLRYCYVLQARPSWSCLKAVIKPA